MKRILIVGAGGQIGSELTVFLRGIYGGSNVVATDMRECRNLGEDGPFEVLNALDATAMASVVAAVDSAETGRPSQIWQIFTMCGSKSASLPPVLA